MNPISYSAFLVAAHSRRVRIARQRATDSVDAHNRLSLLGDLTRAEVKRELKSKRAAVERAFRRLKYVEDSAARLAA